MGLCQGSALSPFLFILILDNLSECFRKGTPWEFLSANDLVVIAESEKELQENWLKWQRSTKKHRLKVYTTKTKVMVNSKEKVTAKVMNCNNVELEQVHNFNYLGVALSQNEGSEKAVRPRINAA